MRSKRRWWFREGDGVYRPCITWSAEFVFARCPKSFVKDGWNGGVVSFMEVAVQLGEGCVVDVLP